MQSAIKALTSFTARNAPLILSGVAVTGVVTTGVLAAKGHLDAQQYRYSVGETSGETIAAAFRARWRCYAPAVVSGILTIAAIVAGSRVYQKRAAAIGIAYSAVKESYEAYRRAVEETVSSEKVTSKIGEKTADIVMGKADEKRIVDQKTVVVSEGETLCLDTFSGRYFSSTMENIRRAVNDVNATVLSEDSASLNVFYESLGLEEISAGDELGWNNQARCGVVFSSKLNRDGRPVLTYSFSPSPIPRWWTWS